MGFPTWTLWGMGLSALGALLAIGLALLAQSPRMLTRLNLAGQRLDLRAKAFTGYGLALLLLAMGFFVAGVPLGPDGQSVVAETGDGPSISLLSPGPGRAFTTDDTINFDWFWPTTPPAGSQFVVYLSDGEQEYPLGFVSEPNNGAAYRLSVAGGELPVVGDGLTWQVRLEDVDSVAAVTSDAVALIVRPAESVAAPNGSQSGAMIGLATSPPELAVGDTLTGTVAADLPLPPGATTGEPGPTVAPEVAATATPQPTATATLMPTATPTPTPPPTPTATPILGPTARVVETSNLPVRARPDSAVLVVLVRGDVVIPLSGHAFHGGETWREISTVQGVIGWVQDQFLAFEE